MISIAFEVRSVAYSGAWATSEQCCPAVATTETKQPPRMGLVKHNQVDHILGKHKRTPTTVDTYLQLGNSGNGKPCIVEATSGHVDGWLADVDRWSAGAAIGLD